MGTPPPWRQTYDADCYSRALLATLFLQRVGPDAGSVVRLAMPARLLVIYRLSFALRQLRPACFQKHWSQPQAHVEMESAIGNAAQHHPGVRMRYRRKTPDEYRTGQALGESSSGHRNHVPTAYSRALLVALFFTASFSPKRPESAVRLASSTVVNRNEGIFQGFVLQRIAR
jgi:hypothetical protein